MQAVTRQIPSGLTQLPSLTKIDIALGLHSRPPRPASSLQATAQNHPHIHEVHRTVQPQEIDGSRALILQLPTASRPVSFKSSPWLAIPAVALSLLSAI